MEFLPDHATTSSMAPLQVEPGDTVIEFASSYRSAHRVRLTALFAVSILAIAVIFRTLFPLILRFQVSRFLASIPEAETSYRSMTPDWWHCGYTMKGLRVSQANGTRMLAAREIHFEVPWRDALRGRWNCRVKIEGFRGVLPADFLNHNGAIPFPAFFPGTGTVAPLNMASLIIEEGSVVLFDPERREKSNFGIQELDLEYRSPELVREPRGVVLDATGRLGSHGEISVRAERVPASTKNAIRLIMDVRDLDMADLHPLVANRFRVARLKGNFGLHAEAWTRGNGFVGFVQPLAEGSRTQWVARKPLPKRPTLAQRLARLFFSQPKGRSQTVSTPIQNGGRLPAEGHLNPGEQGPWRAVHRFFNDAVYKSLRASFGRSF